MIGGQRAALVALVAVTALHEALQKFADQTDCVVCNTVTLSGHEVELSSEMDEIEIAQALGNLTDAAFPQFAEQGKTS